MKRIQDMMPRFSFVGLALYLVTPYPLTGDEVEFLRTQALCWHRKRLADLTPGETRDKTIHMIDRLNRHSFLLCEESEQ